MSSQPTSISTEQCEACHLRPLCLPDHLRDADLIRRLQRAVTSSPPRPRGSLLYTVGDRRHSFFFLRSGSAKAIVSDEQGTACVTSFFFPTDIIGVSSLESPVYQESVELLERSAVCEIKASALEELCGGHGEVLHGLFAKIAGSFELERGARLRNNHASSDARIADLLLEIRRRMQAIGRSTEQIVLPMSRYDIASHLCMAPETVSRGFGRLKDDHLIEVRGKNIRLRNPAALMKLAQGDGNRRASQVVREAG